MLFEGMIKVPNGLEKILKQRKIDLKDATLSLWEIDEESLYIDAIVIAKNKRCKGIGTQLMQAIINYADSKKLTIFLEASTDFGSSIQRLIKFYKRFKFKLDSDYSFSKNEMKRISQLI